VCHANPGVLDGAVEWVKRKFSDEFFTSWRTQLDTKNENRYARLNIQVLCAL
jgi:hypothetical protein